MYVDGKGRRIEFIKEERVLNMQQKIEQRKLNERMLLHPEIFRAYWWHVFFRLALEVRRYPKNSKSLFLHRHYLGWIHFRSVVSIWVDCSGVI